MLRLITISALCITVALGDNSCAAAPKSTLRDDFDPVLTLHPYTLSLQYQGKHICGASLIKPNIAITAAQCTFEKDVFDLEIRGGTVYTECKGAKSTKLTSVCQHKSFDNATKDYDVSVLFLENEILQEPIIREIRLQPENSSISSGAAGTVTGWGFTDDTDNEIYRLHSEQLAKISFSKCKGIYKERLTERMTCYQHRKPKCKGEFGGALNVYSQQEGIASWGAYGTCGSERHPAVFTRISHPEISQHINQCLATFAP